MESEPTGKDKKKRRYGWVIDESKCLSISEVNKLRAVCRKDRDSGLNHDKFAPIRNWFMMELGLYTGLRVGEMVSLKHANLLIDESRSSINVIGKGDKKRAVWINSSFKNECHAYCNYKKQFGYGTDPESPLLNNLNGDCISKRALQKFFKIIIIKADLPSYYYIHCLRHTYATFLLKASNNNYKFVQIQLGHASIKTTQIYTSIIESEGKEAVENLYK